MTDKATSLRLQDGTEAKTQYNLEDGSWSFYHKGEKKPYKCGPCHMTAYSPDGLQDNMEEMIGTWAEDGITCGKCHEEIAESYAKTTHGLQGTGCTECHMPKAEKSAISVASYPGDVRTHIFKINPDAEANVFKTVEDKGKKSLFTKGFVTVEYTCLGCHGSRNKAWASKNATNYHGSK